MPTFTPNFNLEKPTIGGDRNSWGVALNGDMDKIDAALKATKTTADAAVPKAGGTMTGSLIVGVANPPTTPLKLTTAAAGGITLKNDANAFIVFEDEAADAATQIKMEQKQHHLHITTKPTNPGQDDAADLVYGKLYLNGSEVMTSTTTAAKYLAKSGDSNLTIQNTTPSIYMSETDAVGARLVQSGGVFYIRTLTMNSTAEATQPNSRYPMTLNMVTGVADFSGEVAAYSDSRLKHDIRDLSPEEGLQLVEAMNAVRFKRNGIETDSIGVIAQQVREVLPEVVHEDADGYLSVAYANMVAPLIAAVQALSARVRELESR